MAGVGMLFVPLNQAAYLYLKKDQINNATGIFNMLRNEGGSLGIAIVTVMVDRRAQFHHLRLAEQVRPSVPAVDRWLNQYSQNDTIREGVTSLVADQQAMGQLAAMVQNQARELAYLDIFYIFFLMALAALPLVFLMKKAVAKPGAAVH
jgi:DHA2 family multidrug resistance protein